MAYPRLHPHLKDDRHIPGGEHYFIWDACSFVLSDDLHEMVMKNVEGIIAMNKIAKLTETYTAKVKALGRKVLPPGESIHRVRLEIKSRQPSLLGPQYLEPRSTSAPNRDFANADKVSALIAFFFFYGMFDVQTSRGRFAPPHYSQAMDVQLEYAARLRDESKNLTFPKWIDFTTPEMSRLLSEKGFAIAKSVSEEWRGAYPVLDMGLRRFMTRKAPEGKTRKRKNSRKSG